MYSIKNEMNYFLMIFLLIRLSFKFKLIFIMSTSKKYSDLEEIATIGLLKLSEPIVSIKMTSKTYYVEKILNHKYESNGSIKFLVKWEGYDSSSNTWEPIDSFLLRNGKYNSFLIDYCSKF